MPNIVKKAIIPVAGMGTRFLPLSKVLPKELWPLADKPMVQYIVEEAADSGIKEIVFVTNPKRPVVLDYFKNQNYPKKALNAKYKNLFLDQIKKLKNIAQTISFSSVVQKKPLGDGDALLQAEKKIKNSPCAALWADDVVESKVPCLAQLIKVFKKYKKPVIALYRVPPQSFQFYGMVKVKKINKNTFKITDILEKPSIKDAPSNLAIVGKCIITEKVFKYLKKSTMGERKEIGLTETFASMVRQGEDVYGYEIQGKWLECGNKLAYLKSNLYLSLKNRQFGKELKKFLRET